MISFVFSVWTDATNQNEVVKKLRKMMMLLRMEAVKNQHKTSWRTCYPIEGEPPDALMANASRENVGQVPAAWFDLVDATTPLVVVVAVAPHDDTLLHHSPNLLRMAVCAKN